MSQNKRKEKKRVKKKGIKMYRRRRQRDVERVAQKAKGKRRKYINTVEGKWEIEWLH